MNYRQIYAIKKVWMQYCGARMDEPVEDDK